MAELNNFEKLDKILWYLEKKPKGLQYEAESMRDTLKLENPGESFAEIGDLLIFLNKQEFIHLETHTGKFWSRLRIEGSVLINADGYGKQGKNKEEIDRLTKEKLMIDVTNAENVYKSYPLTKRLAIAGFLIGLFLLLLKAAEVLKLLP